LYTTREFLPDMIKNKRGHLVTIASMAGMTALPGLSDYCASKHGAVAIDESVRLELGQKGLSGFIKTTCICPYFINTGMFDGAKKAFPFYILSPIEVADRIIAAIQQEEEKVVIPFRGNVVPLMKLLPVSLADKVGNFLGVNDAMTDFKGKGTVEQRIPGINNK